MQTKMNFSPDVDHLQALGTQIQWQKKEGSEAGTVLLAAHTAGPPVHFHPSQEEIFTVRQGQLQVYRKNAWITCKAGDIISIPRKTPHTYKNTSGDVVIFDFCLTPALDFTRMINLMDSLVQQGKIRGKDFKSMAYLSQVMAAYPKVTQNVAPPQFVIRAMAAISKYFLK